LTRRIVANLTGCLVAGLVLTGCERDAPVDARVEDQRVEAMSPEYAALAVDPIAESELVGILPAGPTCTLLVAGHRMMVATMPMQPPGPSSAVVKIGGRMIPLELDTSVETDRFDAVGLIYMDETIVARATREPGEGTPTAAGTSYQGNVMVMPHDATIGSGVSGEWICSE
jgi:hypothetical protein